MEDLQPPNTTTTTTAYIHSNCSTPFVSAPSSPARTLPGGGTVSGYFYSAPSSPMHSSLLSKASLRPSLPEASFEFEFSARYNEFAEDEEEEIGTMSSADELFLNGQIRPMKLLQSPHAARRRTRSMSPLLRDTTSFDWSNLVANRKDEIERNDAAKEAGEASTPSTGSSSRCSSAGRSPKRWVFLKDFLRSKSDGNKFWTNISFSSPAEDKEKKTAASLGRKSGKETVKRGGVFERHYTAKRAEAEEMRKKTYLPYRQGLFGCLGFSSKSYGAVNNGVARALNPVSSR